MVVTAQENLLDQWFDELVGTLKAHQLFLETGIADEDTKSLYSTLIQGNSDEIAALGNALAQKHFVTQILYKYLSIISKNLPLKLAFDISGQEVLVWAEIEDDNEQLEHALIMAEAKVNAEFHKFGYDLTSMIVEKSEYLSIPNHYSIFKG